MSTQAGLISEEKRPRKISSWTTGMALFSMFFGAGNLIFPLVVGAKAGVETSYTVLGLGLSAVLFPLLGLVAMLFYRGDLRLFLARLGPIPAALLLFILHIAQGPVACLPRLVTLMHASATSFFSISLPLFSFLICLAIFFLAVRPNRLVHLLGAVLTPFLLLTMAVLVIVGVIQGSSLQLSEMGATYHFIDGLKGGYQTMDLIAALLFATLIIPHLLQGTEALSTQERQSHLQKKMLGSSAVAAGLLMVTYIGLCFLASRHADVLAPLAPEQMLNAIAVHVLGETGAWIAACTVFLACLTTALSLAAVFTDYLRKELFRNKPGVALPLALTLGITALMANLGFGGLMKLIGPAMQILYPALIVLCLTNIAYCISQVRPIKVPVYAALGLGALGFCL